MLRRRARKSRDTTDLLRARLSTAAALPCLDSRLHVAVLTVLGCAHEGECVQAKRALVVDGAEGELSPRLSPQQHTQPAVHTIGNPAALKKLNVGFEPTMVATWPRVSGNVRDQVDDGVDKKAMMATA